MDQNNPKTLQDLPNDGNSQQNSNGLPDLPNTNQQVVQPLNQTVPNTNSLPDLPNNSGQVQAPNTNNLQSNQVVEENASGNALPDLPVNNDQPQMNNMQTTPVAEVQTQSSTASLPNLPDGTAPIDTTSLKNDLPNIEESINSKKSDIEKKTVFSTRRPSKKLALLFIPVLFLFLIGILLALYLSDDAGGIKDVTITNLTANSASISWVTEDVNRGSVVYGTSNNFMPLFLTKNGKEEAFDDRDSEFIDGESVLKTGSLTDRTTHHVTLLGLEPNTTYYFKVGNSNRFFDGEVASFTTTTVVDTIRTPDPVYQVVNNFVDGELEPIEGVIYYYVYNPEDQTMKSKLYSSVLNGEQSNWTGDLGYILNEKGALFNVKDEYKLNVYAKTDKGYGLGDYLLNEYKPLNTLQVNVRYNEK